MRHRKSGRHLSRTSSHRNAMFRNMAASLFQHEMIKTTVPKAKELRRVAEPLITLAKTDGVAQRRLAFDRLRDAAAVGKLFQELGPRYQERKGGYLRILKCGYRPGLRFRSRQENRTRSGFFVPAPKRTGPARRTQYCHPSRYQDSSPPLPTSAPADPTPGRCRRYC